MESLNKMKSRIEIMDSTLRDGEQTNGVSFLPHEKLMIARLLLEKVNVDRLEVASARVSEGEKEAVTGICRFAEQAGYLDRIEVLGFVDHNKSVDWIADTGTCWRKARTSTAPSNSTKRPNSISRTSSTCSTTLRASTST